MEKLQLIQWIEAFQVSFYFSCRKTFLKVSRYCNCSQNNNYVLFCFVFKFHGHTCSTWKFSGQGLNPSFSLCGNCGNATSLNPLCWARDQTTCLLSNLSHCSKILNLLCHSGISDNYVIFKGYEFLLWLNGLRTQLVYMRMWV